MDFDTTPAPPLAEGVRRPTGKTAHQAARRGRTGVKQGLCRGRKKLPLHNKPNRDKDFRGNAGDAGVNPTPPLYKGRKTVAPFLFYKGPQRLPLQPLHKSKYPEKTRVIREGVTQNRYPCYPCNPCTDRKDNHVGTIQTKWKAPEGQKQGHAGSQKATLPKRNLPIHPTRSRVDLVDHYRVPDIMTWQAGKPTDLKCHWCGGPLNLSGHTTIDTDGTPIRSTYLVGVDCLVAYTTNTDHQDKEVRRPCNHEYPNEQLAMFGHAAEPVK